MKLATVNFLVFVFSLLFGFLYTYFTHFSLKKYKIDEAKRTFKLRQHLRLILINLFTLCLIAFFGLYLVRDMFVIECPSFFTFIIQFILIMIFDDWVFYFWHRLLHTNPFLMRRIHSIHHRARVPYPIEFVYAHPIEWMCGMLGLVIVIPVIVIFFDKINAYVFWAYTGYRTLRELDIHSNIIPLIFKHIPFICNSKHHGLHHSYARGNYASTFTYLDKLFKTELRVE